MALNYHWELKTPSLLVKAEVRRAFDDKVAVDTARFADRCCLVYSGVIEGPGCRLGKEQMHSRESLPQKNMVRCGSTEQLDGKVQTPSLENTYLDPPGKVRQSYKG